MHSVDFLEGEPHDYGKRHVAKAVCELSDLERRYFMHADERALCRLCGERTDSGRTSTANCIGSDRQRRLERPRRSEEHTSELQSHHDLVCRLLLEKKKK